MIVFIFICVILITVYLNGKNNEIYWKKRGVKFYTKNKMTGIFWDYLFKNRALFEILNDLYKKYPDEPAVGIGSFLTPMLFVKDIRNIRHIHQTEFECFHHRGFEPIAGDPLSDNILFMYGNRWKLMRQNMTPIFTTTKLRKMFYVVDKTSSDFVEFMKNNPEKLNGNSFSLIKAFCYSSVAAAVFGISEESKFDVRFLKMYAEGTKQTFWTDLKYFFMNIFPGLSKKLKFKIFSEFTVPFIGSIKRVIRQRELEVNPGNAFDFIDRCLELQTAGTMKDRETGLELEPTDELLAAQAFFFFIAGVDPSSITYFSVLMELGKRPEILARVQKEIDEIFESKDVTYNAIIKMEYLDKVIDECLRLYPPIGYLTRKCTKDSVLPVGNIKLEEGTMLFTPVYDLHHDPVYFPEPEVFNPDRFSGGVNTSNIDGYMPYGCGKRKCIGVRFVRVQVKTGLVYILRSFNVKTIVNGDKIKFAKEQMLVKFDNVHLEFNQRNAVSEAKQ